MHSASPSVGRGRSERRAAPALPSLPALLCVALGCKAAASLVWLGTTHPLAALTLFVAPDPFLLYALFVPSAQGLGRVFTRFEADQPDIWLTIDDGPDERDTPQILDLLDRHKARATFFVVGEQAERLPHLIAEIRRRGHEVAHHTQTHPAWTFWCAGPRRLARELDAGLDAMAQAGIRPTRFRPPVGIKHLLLSRALSARGLDCVGWTIRSGDCRSDSPESLAAEVSRRLQPGAIVLLHEGRSVPPSIRIKGLALLLEQIASRGLRCVIPARDQLR